MWFLDDLPPSPDSPSPMPRPSAAPGKPAWFRTAPAGRLNTTRCASPLSISTTSSIYSPSSRSVSPASPGPSTPSSPSYAASSTLCDSLADHSDSEPYPSESPSCDTCESCDGCDGYDSSEESPVTPTVWAFIQREQDRVRAALLKLEEMWIKHGLGAKRAARRAVTREYAEQALAALDEWDETLHLLVEAFDFVDHWFTQSTTSSRWSPRSMRDAQPQKFKALAMENRQVASRALDIYLRVRFETLEELDQLADTWESMIRLV